MCIAEALCNRLEHAAGSALRTGPVEIHARSAVQHPGAKRDTVRLLALAPVTLYLALESRDSPSACGDNAVISGGSACSCDKSVMSGFWDSAPLCSYLDDCVEYSACKAAWQLGRCSCHTSVAVPPQPNTALLLGHRQSEPQGSAGHCPGRCPDGCFHQSGIHPAGPTAVVRVPVSIQ
jgi:hypothetical protein